MLTKEQLNQIAGDFQIDSFTAFREYFQLVFLNYLYQEKQAEAIYFKGGTCLRLLYNSPRFSEDLDFSTKLSKKILDGLLEKVITKLQKEISQIELSFIYQGKNSLRYKIKYQGEEFKYPLSIRIDFSLERVLLEADISRPQTKIPINFVPLLIHLQEEEILAEKIRAFLARAKGRDIFDFWFLLGKNISLNQKLLEKKLKKAFDKEKLLAKIKKYPEKKLEMELVKFLPKHYRKIIPLLKEKLVEKFKKYVKQ